SQCSHPSRKHRGAYHSDNNGKEKLPQSRRNAEEARRQVPGLLCVSATLRQRFSFPCYSATISPSTAWPRFKRNTSGNAMMNNKETRTNTRLYERTAACRVTITSRSLS